MSDRPPAPTAIAGAAPSPGSPALDTAPLPVLREAWLAAWPAALATWSKFTQLRPPALCLSDADAQGEGLTGSFAMIRLVDQAIIVSLPAVRRSGVDAFAREVLAHEIGHHVLAPATVDEHTRLLAHMHRALPTLEQHAPMVANLYTDLLINDRLQRTGGLRMAEVYRRLAATAGRCQASALWALYLRIYEHLWSLPRGDLGGAPLDDRGEGDAQLGARLLRSYARDWLYGGGRFATLVLPYLVEDQQAAEAFTRLLDTRHAARGGSPTGLVEEDPDEGAGNIHPAHDPALNGAADLADPDSDAAPSSASTPAASTVTTTPREHPAEHTPSAGQAREPFRYGEILRAAGVELDDHEAAVRYYRERARPHLIPFPRIETPETPEPLAEGLEPWDFGHPLDAADWLQSVLVSPHIVPGLTTVQRTYGTMSGRTPERLPLDLDLYVDCSGSMPNPQRATSFLTLAGAIVCLSALRAGARVQATLWSGKNEFTTTEGGFTRDETAILRVLTGYFGGGTQFPIHLLRETYTTRRRDARLVHLLVISDDGVSTMFDRDERGNSGWDVAAMALARARGGGTLVLNLPDGWESLRGYGDAYPTIKRARDQQGWHVHPVRSWASLVDFARAFSRQRYGPSTVRPGAPRGSAPCPTSPNRPRAAASGALPPRLPGASPS